MARRADRHRQLILCLLAVGVLSVATPASAAEGDCYYDPVERTWVCDDGGDGDGGGGSTTSYWTSWTLVGPCGGGGGVGGGLVGIRTGLLMAVRYHYVNGEVVETQTVCIDLDGAETDAWEAINSAAVALPDPGWESNPDSTISKGLTGLETWIWSSHGTQVGPITATWAEPVTGIVFAVEGRGWTETISWDTGDAAYDVFASTFFDAVGLGGTPAEPPVTHLYETTSLDAGFSTGYPVSVDLLWVGEYRVGVDTGGGTVWTDWARVASTLAENFPATYDVVEVRSQLKG